MKICITGASGMLADAVVKEIEQNGAGLFDGPVSVSKSDFTPRSSDIIKIDVSDIYEVQKWVDSVRPDYIFHLAAETDVDLCERAPDNCYKTNMIGTENVALISRRNDIPLLYISTAAIFSGNKSEPYIEFDNPGPVNTYGKSKLFGEFAVQGLLKKYFIVRAGWMVGGWNIDKKFVYKIVMQLLSGAREINVVNDKFGSLTFTNDFAKNLLILLKTERYGIYHMANVGVASRFEIAKKIVEYMGMEDKVKINPINSANYPLAAPRPRSEMIRNLHLELIDLNCMPRWELSLQRYIFDHIK